MSVQGRRNSQEITIVCNETCAVVRQKIFELVLGSQLLNVWQHSQILNVLVSFQAFFFYRKGRFLYNFKFSSCKHSRSIIEVTTICGQMILA